MVEGRTRRRDMLRSLYRYVLGGGGLIFVNNQPCCMLCPRFDCICELCSIDSGIMFEQDERDREKAKMLIGIYWFF